MTFSIITDNNYTLSNVSRLNTCTSAKCNTTHRHTRNRDVHRYRDKCEQFIFYL